MSSGGDRNVPAIRKIYSYATVADTFFWGEKRNYLPLFQRGVCNTNPKRVSNAEPRLKIVPLGRLQD